jgi:hypothetical protein
LDEGQYAHPDSNPLAGNQSMGRHAKRAAVPRTAQLSRFVPIVLDSWPYTASHSSLKQSKSRRGAGCTREEDYKGVKKQNGKSTGFVAHYKIGDAVIEMHVEIIG